MQNQIINDKQISEFVGRLSTSAGANLRAVILYGSAASEEFHKDFSDINVLCVLHDLSAEAMRAASPAVHWWTEKNHPAPLLFTQEEVVRSADVFPIELLDIQQQHRVLSGEDIFSALQVPMDLHRVQLEHELRTKLLLLRQQYVACSHQGTPKQESDKKGRKKVSALMLESISSFITLFRHTLITMGEKPPKAKREIVQRLAQRLSFEAGPFLQILEMREGRLKAEALDVQGTFANYVKAVERVIQAVDAL